MNRLFCLIITFLGLSASSQVVNNMVVFCNDGEPFTLILNGERINMEPQTRVRAEGLNLKKYQTKVIFKNPDIKEANTTITFFSSGFECEFGVNKKSKKKYKIEYFTEKRINAVTNPPPVENTPNTQPVINENNPNTVTAPTPTASPTNTVITGPGIISGKCETPMNESQFASFKNSVQNLSTDAEKQAKSLLMLEAACITVNQLKQLLNVFLSDNAKYDFAKQAYEKTKDNSEYAKLTEVFLDVMIKEKFQKFVQSKK